MTTTPASVAAFVTAPLPAAPAAPATTNALAHAARIILPHLERGQRVDAPTLRVCMECAFGGSDADGAWDWIEKLASLPPVHGALDQIVQRFGTEVVAEVTGRSRRIVGKGDRLLVENRAGSANLAETQAFMDDEKRILVFSDAGGTGRSYHAEMSAQNRRLRVHYLLESGWKADTAIQGSAAPTARTRRSRRCSGRSQPT